MEAAPTALLVDARVPRVVHAGPPSTHAAAFAVIGVLSFAAAALLRLDHPLLGLLACPVRAATGVPCPGCGATHALVLLAHGDAGAALFASPLAALGAIALWAASALTLLRCCGLKRALWIPPPSPPRARALRWLALGALAANWAFVAFVSRGGAR